VCSTRGFEHIGVGTWRHRVPRPASAPAEVHGRPPARVPARVGGPEPGWATRTEPHRRCTHCPPRARCL